MGESLPDASEANSASPGSCGNEALWCSIEPIVDVEEGLDMGSTPGNDCLSSSTVEAVLKSGRSRACCILGLPKCSDVWVLGEALYMPSVEAVIAIWRKLWMIAFLRLNSQEA